MSHHRSGGWDLLHALRSLGASNHARHHAPHVGSALPHPHLVHHVRHVLGLKIKRVYMIGNKLLI